MRKLAAALLLGLACTAPSLADDGSAQLAAGGIVFTKSADIRMAKEDLYLSKEKVRIRFEFQNTGADQDVTIAFPLPDLDIEDFQGEEVGTVTDDPLNFVGFTAKVDGKPVAFQSEQRAFIKGKDVSAIVRAAGLPLNLIAHGGYDKLDKLSDTQKKALAKAGIVDYEDNHAEPLWTVRTRFYWTQHFPAGKTVVIEHGYKPVTGGGQYYDSTDAPASADEWSKPFCFDPGTSALLRKMLADPKLRAKDGDFNNAVGGPLWAYTTDYILKTANTWKGPIGHFHLTLDKLEPKAILNLCWKGDLKKTGPTTFEFTADDFAPTQDIHMLVLQ
jgi:hypothetical protein